MGWRKEEMTAEPAMLDRLMSRKVEEWPAEGKIMKGFVPLLVGEEDGEEEKILVHVKVLKDPRFVALLEAAAAEFGYRQRGVIRMPCNVRHFQSMVDAISKSKNTR